MTPLHDFKCPACYHIELDRRYDYEDIKLGIPCPVCGVVMEILYDSDRSFPFKLIGKDWQSGGRT